MSDILELAYQRWLEAEEYERQKRIVVARKYFDGEHDLPLTDRQKEYLGLHTGVQFTLNYCPVVVQAVSERLLVLGFDSDEQADDEDNKAQVAQVENWWKVNRMQARQREVHEDALVDGETFVVLEWDQDKQVPVFLPHPRYTDPMVEGTGFGCRAFYENDDPNQAIKFAVKRWVETLAEPNGRRTVQRMNVYYPDRIERYVAGADGQWDEYHEDGLPWPQPWIAVDGTPLGVPVIHFRNPREKSELRDAIPAQMVLNKIVLDLLAAGDTEGFRILFASGWLPTTDNKPPAKDGNNLLKVAPGQILGSTSAGAKLDSVPAGNLAQLLEMKESAIMDMARITGTPLARFQVTRQVSAEGSQKQSEGPLLSKIEARQEMFGDAWVDCLNVARRMANEFGGAGMDEDVQFSTQWRPAAVRDEQAELDQADKKHNRLGIPLEQVWSELGYTSKEIEQMKQSPEFQSRMAQAELAQSALKTLRDNKLS